jgi:hypothetical protein
MQLDIEFSVGRVGAVADGETAVSPAAARSKPYPKLRLRGGGSRPDENRGLVGSSRPAS